MEKKTGRLKQKPVSFGLPETAGNHRREHKRLTTTTTTTTV